MWIGQNDVICTCTWVVNQNQYVYLVQKTFCHMHSIDTVRSTLLQSRITPHSLGSTLIFGTKKRETHTHTQSLLALTEITFYNSMWSGIQVGLSV